MDGKNSNSLDSEQFDILTKRIIVKFNTKQQIFFGEKKGVKTPVRIYINKKDNIARLERINDIKVLELSTSQDIICNRKIRLVLKFKIALYVEYEGASLGIIELPEDSPLKTVIRTSFPVYIGDKEYLSIINDNYFKWTIDIPFSMFDAPVTQELIEDPALQSQAAVKEIKTDFDILADTALYSHNEQSQQTTATPVDIKIFANLLLNLFIEQNILIRGIPID